MPTSRRSGARGSKDSWGVHATKFGFPKVAPTSVDLSSIEQGINERWPITVRQRAALVQALCQVAMDPRSKPGDRVRAVAVLLAADRVNLEAERAETASSDGHAAESGRLVFQDLLKDSRFQDYTHRWLCQSVGIEGAIAEMRGQELLDAIEVRSRDALIARTAALTDGELREIADQEDRLEH